MKFMFGDNFLDLLVDLPEFTVSESGELGKIGVGVVYQNRVKDFVIGSGFVGNNFSF